MCQVQNQGNEPVSSAASEETQGAQSESPVPFIPGLPGNTAPEDQSILPGLPGNTAPEDQSILPGLPGNTAPEDQSLLPGLNVVPLDQSTCPDGNPSQGGKCAVPIGEGESPCPEGASAEECTALLEQQALVPGTCPEGVSAEECTALLEQQALVPGTCPEGVSAEECHCST